MSSSNAARVQGAGPSSGDGDPIDVNVLSGGGGAVTIADGADVCEGRTTDAAVTSDANGTVSGKLRGLVKILASVWDSANSVLKIAVGGAVALTAFINGSAAQNVIAIGYAYDDKFGVFRRMNCNANVDALPNATSGASRSATNLVAPRGNKLLLIVTVSGALTGTLTPSLQTVDQNGGVAVTIWTAAAAIAGTGTFLYYFADGALITGSAYTQVIPCGLPGGKFNIVLTKSDGSNWTFGASYGIAS